jgi:hypothetical protein
MLIPILFPNAAVRVGDLDQLIVVVIFKGSDGPVGSRDLQQIAAFVECIFRLVARGVLDLPDLAVRPP